MEPTSAHCNSCGGMRYHEVLFSDSSSWSDDKYPISGGDRYETLKCNGCHAIKLRHTSWFSEEPENTVNYYPPAIFRPEPSWMDELQFQLPLEEFFVLELLKEIYVALQNNQPRLAAMGIRSLIERVMIAKAEDSGSFNQNLSAFEKLGYISRIQSEHIKTILDAGHATIHRDYKPSENDVLTLVDVAEHLIETVYLHEPKIKALKGSVPSRSK